MFLYHHCPPLSIFFYPFFSIQFFVVLEAGGEYKNHFYSFLYLLLFFFRPIDIFGGFEADSSISSIFVRAIYFEQLSFHPRPIECCSKNLRSAILSHADADGESWNILSNLSRFLQFLCVCVCVCWKKPKIAKIKYPPATHCISSLLIIHANEGYANQDATS